MWPDETLEKVFTVFLDVVLLIIPLLIMGVMYGLIVNHLWKVDQGNNKKKTIFVCCFFYLADKSSR